MAEVARLIGGAGTGKTTELLRIMSKVIDTGGVDADSIGFVSFTKAARREAASRAAEQFGASMKDLETNGWFRTLHSVCYKCLSPVSGLLSGDAESRKWICEWLQESVGGQSLDDESYSSFDGATDADKALTVWSAARNRLQTLREAWECAWLSESQLPNFEYCERITNRYEEGKLLDHRLDFTDLLGRFAGYKFRVGGHDQIQPEGWVPAVPVWFFDEQQDAGPLLDAVCKRLVAADSCRWAYVVGDPFQSIYGFAGADSRCFMSWPAVKERIMPKSYRCPKPIHQLGEDVLRECSNYFDRKIEPADHYGEVGKFCHPREVIGEVDPRQSWLLIARSNYQAKRFANLLDEACVPWLPTKGNGGWNAPSRNLALGCLYNIEQGAPVSGEEWAAAIKLLPSKHDGEELLERGTKKRFVDRAEAAKYDFVLPPDLGQLGATPRLMDVIRSKQWRRMVDHGGRYVGAVNQWGTEAVREINVRVGTIHSVKGAEADNVALLTTTSGTVGRAAETTDGRDEENRIAYVGITRARKRLFVVDEPKQRNKMEIYA